MMGKQVALAGCMVFLLFFLPWLWGEPAKPPELPETPPAADGIWEDCSTKGVDGNTLLRVKLGNRVQEMDMQTYLVGVVRAEMPASFQEEALKAQAIAARTYTLYKMEHGGSPNHPEADACDDIHCCKAYLGLEEALERWGADGEQWEAKIESAVRDTDGLCVLYEGSPILAVFHGFSAGMTQDAAAVWSSSLPYLQSVPSPENETSVPHYRTEVSFTGEELKSILEEGLPDAVLQGDPSTWFSGIRQENSGAVTELTVGGTTVRGSRLRELLGLRSPCFTIGFEEGRVVFSVTGYGHGVGMSQYGANMLAEEGKTADEILTRYYTGCTVDSYVPDGGE